jgi:hypothetical protein
MDVVRLVQNQTILLEAVFLKLGQKIKIFAQLTFTEGSPCSFEPEGPGKYKGQTDNIQILSSLCGRCALHKS